MPKKFANEHTKASEARARKQAAKDAETAKKNKEVEESYWKDDNKQLAKKQQKKEEQEKKRQQLLERKAENKALLEKEQETIKPAKAGPAPKITRNQIALAEAAEAAAASKKEKEKSRVVVPELELEENFNRMEFEGDEARTIEEAIVLLRGNDFGLGDDKKGGAAFKEFLDRRLNEMKAEGGAKMRLSQLKNMIFKEWLRSPENPNRQ